MNKTFAFFLYVLAGILGTILGVFVFLHPVHASFATDPDTVSSAAFFTDVPPEWSKIVSSQEWAKLSPEQKGIVADKWYKAVFDHANSLGGVTDGDKKKLYDFYQKVHAEAVTVPLGLAIVRFFPDAIHFLFGAGLLSVGITAFWRASRTLVLALAIVMAAIIVACAFRFTPVTTRAFGFNGEATSDHVLTFDHWTGNRK